MGAETVVGLAGNQRIQRTDRAVERGRDEDDAGDIGKRIAAPTQTQCRAQQQTAHGMRDEAQLRLASGKAFARDQLIEHRRQASGRDFHRQAPVIGERVDGLGRESRAQQLDQRRVEFGDQPRGLQPMVRAGIVATADQRELCRNAALDRPAMRPIQRIGVDQFGALDARNENDGHRVSGCERSVGAQALALVRRGCPGSNWRIGALSLASSARARKRACAPKGGAGHVLLAGA